MARVQVGVICYRDSDGNFLPETKPIYREIPENKPPIAAETAEGTEPPHEEMMLGNMPISRSAEREFYHLLAKRVREWKMQNAKCNMKNH